MKFDNLVLELYTGQPFDDIINRYLSTGHPDEEAQIHIQTALAVKHDCERAQLILKQIFPDYNTEDWSNYLYMIAHGEREIPDVTDPDKKGFLDDYAMMTPREIAEDFIFWVKQKEGPSYSDIEQQQHPGFHEFGS